MKFKTKIYFCTRLILDRLPGVLAAKNALRTMPLFLLPFWIASAAMGQSGTPSFNFKAVALSGQAAPGTAAGVVFSQLDQYPLLSPTGQTTFGAELSGTGVVIGTNFTGIWTGTPGSVALVARAANQVPGTPTGTTYDESQGFIINGPDTAGEMALNASYANSPSPSAGYTEGIWVGTPGNLAPVVRDGDQAPGQTAGVYFTDITSAAQNASGQIAFASFLYGTGITSQVGLESLWSGAPGNIALLAKQGDQAPGMAVGIKYTTLGSSYLTPPISASGQSVFIGSFAGSGVTSSNNTALWFGTPGNVSQIARTGSQAPGVTSGANFSSFNPPTINSVGQVLFSATLTGTGVSSVNSAGIWAGSPGSLAVLARTGDQAPGTAPGVTYNGLQIYSPQYNSAGQAAFGGLLTGTGVTSANNTGVWLGAPGQVRLVTRNGDQAPGTSAGTIFSQMEGFSLNNAGDMLLFCRLTGTGVTNANSDGLWFEDATTDTLSLVVREGSLFEVAPGDVRTISSLSIGQAVQGESSGSVLNDSNEFVFSAVFTDGSNGIFNAVPTPEPGPCALLAVGFGALLIMRRPRKV
jgi:hypothetical protein